MSPRRLTREESQARTRERLVRTAEKIFLKRGYHDASIGQIAETAGYTTGAVYSNFASKEELALAVLETRLLSVAEAVQSAFANAEPTVPARLAALEALWDNFLGDEEWIVLATEFSLATRKNPAVRARFNVAVERAQQLIIALLSQQQVQADLRLTFPPERLAAAILALGLGLSVLRYVNPDLGAGIFSEGVAALLHGQDERAALISSRTGTGPGSTPAS